jgi:hypothetical protein
MSTRVEATDQETLVLAHLRGASLHFTENRRTILTVFLAAPSRSPSATCGFAQRRPTTEPPTAAFGDC